MKYTIGIDPDTKAHGVAVFENGKLTKLDTWTLVQLLGFLENSPYNGAKWVIEDVTKNNFVYGRNAQQSKQAHAKIARNVGMCQQAMAELVRFLEHYQQEYKLIPPNSHNWAKDPDRFKLMTGWKARSNPDTRSAAFFGFLGL